MTHIDSTSTANVTTPIEKGDIHECHSVNNEKGDIHLFRDQEKVDVTFYPVRGIGGMITEKGGCHLLRVFAMREQEP